MKVVDKVARIKGSHLEVAGTPIRNGDDGYFGRLMENALGVEENNRKGPDCAVEGVEIKTKRAQSGARTTLFCMEPKWDINKNFSSMREAVAEFKNAEHRFNQCMNSQSENPRGLKLFLSDKEIFAMCYEQPLCRWEIEAVLDRCEEKLCNMVFAEIDGMDSEPKMVKGVSFKGFDRQKFLTLLKGGKVVVEFRAKIEEGGGCRNRGTAFRMAQKYIAQMYKSSREI
jgi:hypothetical protein